MNFELKDGRELCWDFDLVEKAENVKLTMHQPTRKNVAITFDKPWEGNHCGYFSPVCVDGKFRIYYRSNHTHMIKNDIKNGVPNVASLCFIESEDGKTFSRPTLSKFEYGGNPENNICWRTGRYWDNFSVYYDENPDCPPDEKFKGLGLNMLDKLPDSVLSYFKSADGITFTFVKHMPIKGAFDSLNLVLWDESEKEYKLFFRDDHKRPVEVFDMRPDDLGTIIEVRDVKMTRSKDFKTWSEPVLLDYGPDAVPYEFYTNGVRQYKRARHMFLGMPTRYVDRRDNPENFEHLTWRHDDSRARCIEDFGREGTVVTDAVLITSRDGEHFHRTDEPFLTPGLYDGYSNWIYGDCYPAAGWFETESDIPGEPNELSIYVGSGYRIRPVDLVRYTIRMDGFFSWHGGYKGGSLLTKPFTFEGNSMEINFATSALGYLRIKLCDEAGNELAGYDSGNLFGDHIDRPVTFEKPLAALVGKSVRLKLEFKDAHLYSFKFNK